jgi:uncharacterized protein (TIGR02246 family)
MSASDTVARQVNAYNAHDLEAFLACYTDDVLVTTGHGDVLLEGIGAVREQYDEWFTQLSGLHAQVHHRIERGNWVVDDERATAEGLDVEALVAYHVKDHLIDRVVLMTAEPQS